MTGTTVLVLPGAASFSQFGESGFATVKACGGGPDAILTQLGLPGPANVVEVPYNDWDASFGYQDGANKAASAILATPAGQHIVLVGHSFGSVALQQLIRNPTMISGVDPSLLTFVLFANSARINNGMMGWLYGGYGPSSTKYRVYDLAQEWDRWADYPNVTNSPYFWQAYNNVNMGDNVTDTPGGVPNNIHNSYQNVRLTDTAAAQITIGTVTFMLFEHAVPNAKQVTRAQLNGAYNRIVHPTWT